jgi:hypothetical protein
MLVSPSRLPRLSIESSLSTVSNFTCSKHQVFNHIEPQHKYNIISAKLERHTRSRHNYQRLGIYGLCCRNQTPYSYRSFLQQRRTHDHRIMPSFLRYKQLRLRRRRIRTGMLLRPLLNERRRVWRHRVQHTVHREQQGALRGNQPHQRLPADDLRPSILSTERERLYLQRLLPGAQEHEVTQRT